MTTLDLGTYFLTISRDNTGHPAAYVGDSSEASASGEAAILASFLQDARNAGAEDTLYAALSAAKTPDAMSNRNALLIAATDLDKTDSVVPRHIRASISSAAMGVALSGNEAYELNLWANEADRGAWGRVAAAAQLVDSDRSEGDEADHAYTAAVLRLLSK